MGNWRGQTLQAYPPCDMTDYPEAPQILESINKTNTVLLALHINPDSDSVGSNLALALVLKNLGKTVEIYSADVPPQNLDFLPAYSQITLKDPKEVDIGKFKLAIFLDSSDKLRITRHEHLSLPGGITTVVMPPGKDKCSWRVIRSLSELSKKIANLNFPISTSLGSLRVIWLYAGRKSKFCGGTSAEYISTVLPKFFKTRASARFDPTLSESGLMCSASRTVFVLFILSKIWGASG